MSYLRGNICSILDFVKSKNILIYMSYLFLGYIFALHVFRIVDNFNGVSEGLADASIMFEQWLVHSGLMSAIIAVYKRSMSNFIFVISLILGHYLNEYYILTHHLHYFLQENMLYPYFLYSPVNTVNVQYGVLFPYLIYLLILLFMIFFKNTRSILRTYVTIFCGVAWSTTLVFHLVFVQWSLMDSVSLIQDGRQEIAERLVKNNYLDKINDECESYSFLCFRANNEDGFAISDFGVFEQRIEGEVNSLHYNLASSRSNDLVSKKYKINLLSKEVSGNQFTLYHKDTVSYLLIDKLDYNPFVWLHKIFFGFFVGLAHLVWIFGAYYFLNYHQVRFRRLSYK